MVAVMAGCASTGAEENAQAYKENQLQYSPQEPNWKPDVKSGDSVGRVRRDIPPKNQCRPRQLT